MRAYKFLDANGRAPFTATPWHPGEWVNRASARPCHEGVHACLPSEVAYWLDAALWEVELEGEVVETRRKVVGSRGRLVAPVEEYRAAVRELAELGAWRCREWALEALTAAGQGDGELSAASTAAASLDELIAIGAMADETTYSGRAAALAADAAYFAQHGLPAQSPFVAACAAGHFAAGPDGDQQAYDGGFAAERDLQSRWLTERLGL